LKKAIDGNPVNEAEITKHSTRIHEGVVDWTPPRGRLTTMARFEAPTAWSRDSPSWSAGHSRAVREHGCDVAGDASVLVTHDGGVRDHAHAFREEDGETRDHGNEAGHHHGVLSNHARVRGHHEDEPNALAAGMAPKDGVHGNHERAVAGSRALDARAPTAAKGSGPPGRASR
jgi:hypothetical protein